MAKISETFYDGDYADERELIVGLECEIESIKTWRNENEWANLWGVTEDGSLRNNGREFISKPLTVTSAVDAFVRLHKNLVYRNPAEAFTERTSIHVHVNCQNLEQSTVRDIILLYALYEEFFFAQTHPSRRDNIHCVPLTETFLPAMYGRTLPSMHERWQKYTALNIRPLSEHGTIEFRHMHGHNDHHKLSDWLGLLTRLVKLAQDKPISSVEYFKKDNITDNFNYLFSPLPNYKEMASRRDELMYNQLLDVKLSWI